MEIKLINKIANNNFGALKIIKELCYFSQWLDIMLFLEENNIIGDKIYLLYEKCNFDIHILGNKVLSLMNNYCLEYLKNDEVYDYLLKGEIATLSEFNSRIKSIEKAEKKFRVKLKKLSRQKK